MPVKATSKFDIDVYGYQISVTVFTKWNAVKKIYLQFGGDGGEREGFMIAPPHKLNKIHIFVNRDNFSCGIHELVHVKNLIFRDTGMKSVYDSDEHEAYLMQYLYKKYEDAFEECCKLLH